jgi:Flp pilus assembly protein TadG
MSMRRRRGSETGTSTLEFGLLVAVIVTLVVVVLIAIGVFLRTAS